MTGALDAKLNLEPCTSYKYSFTCCTMIAHAKKIVPGLLTTFEFIPFTYSCNQNTHKHTYSHGQTVCTNVICYKVIDSGSVQKRYNSKTKLETSTKYSSVILLESWHKNQKTPGRSAQLHGSACIVPSK